MLNVYKQSDKLEMGDQEPVKVTKIGFGFL